MMNLTVFGVGAAGNKAVITLLKNKVVDQQHVKLLNTTSKDIPEEDIETVTKSNLFVPLPSALGGCGKESAKGRAAMLKAIKGHLVNFGKLFNEDSSEVVIVSSVEGGTGSGSAPVIATYFSAMNIPVHVFALIGFQDEARGINNTLKFFKDLPSGVILHTINNAAFLDHSDNYGKAEQAANEEFSKQIDILRGSKIVPSKQNIDDTDLYKVNTTPGYMTINHIPLNGVKNADQFNSAIAASFDNVCYLDSDPSAKRIAVIINTSKPDAIDNKFEVIQRYVGTPFEIFRHIQNDGDDEYINIIACGMNYPERAIKDINSKYEQLKQGLNSKYKSFDDIFGSLDLDTSGEYDVDVRRMADPADVDKLFANEDFGDINPNPPAAVNATNGVMEDVITVRSHSNVDGEY